LQPDDPILLAQERGLQVAGDLEVVLGPPAVALGLLAQLGLVVLAQRCQFALDIGRGGARPVRPRRAIGAGALTSPTPDRGPSRRVTECLGADLDRERERSRALTAKRLPGRNEILRPGFGLKSVENPEILLRGGAAIPLGAYRERKSLSESLKSLNFLVEQQN
jgi:hypothetical protein